MNPESKLKEIVGNGFLKKKVLLTTLSSPFLDNAYVFPYLGILYLLSVAKDSGMRSCFVDKKNPPTPELMEQYDVFYTDEFEMDKIENYSGFDLVGISCMTPQGKEAYEIRKKLKSTYPEMTIMIGGPHSKHYLGECINEGFDIVINGDGERIFEALLKGDVETLKSRISITEGHALVFNDMLSESEMTSYPVPYREEQYIKKYQYLLDGNMATTIVNSRGCPMGCTFCEDRRTAGRWFSTEHFEAEIKAIVDLGIKGIMIFDDLFAISAVKLKPYTEILKKYHHSHGLIYRCFGHAGTMSRHPQMAKLLAESGCVEIGFGAETASQEILDVVAKGTKVRQMHDFVEICIAEGIRVKAFFMIGLPSESYETFNDTYQFIKQYRTKYPTHFDFDCCVFFPYKGTVIGDVARTKDGHAFQIDRNNVDNRYYNIRPVKGLTWEQIDNGEYGAYKKAGGKADIVLETYDWKTGKVLLSADDIRDLKDKTMELSGRYADAIGGEKKVIEGSIGSYINKDKKVA